MRTTLPTDPRDLDFGQPPLPEWVGGFREHQVSGIEDALVQLAGGTRVVLMNAPTGAGKTLIAEVLRRLHPAQHALYVCTTKTLQDQFKQDYPYAKVLKGRRNYPTLDKPELFDDRFKPLTAGDCTKERTTVPACDGCPDFPPSFDGTQPSLMHCSNCHPWQNCPYEVAKREALSADIAVTNTAFFLGEANGSKQLSDQKLVIVDECDTLESLLMGQVEVVIGERLRKKLGLGFPSKKTVETAWVEWVVEDAMPKTLDAWTKADRAMKLKRTVDNVKEANMLGRLTDRLVRMSEQIQKEDGEGVPWIYDSSAQKEGTVSFKPVRVDAVAEDMLWRHSAQWVCMSATIIDPVEFTESLGLGRNDWGLVNVPNTFPKENRPIHVVGGPSMSKKNIEETQGGAVRDMAALVGKVLVKHPDERVLVHTVSYKLAQDLFDLLRREHGDRLIVYGGAGDREKALAAYKEKTNAVALAPSWDRGVDLPGDLCRVLVVAKIPFPNLGDKQVSARLYSRGGDQWYRVNTVRTIVQMLGRGVRSESDSCRTYILDRQFMTNVWSKSRTLIPGYVKEAIDFSGGVL